MYPLLAPVVTSALGVSRCYTANLDDLIGLRIPGDLLDGVNLTGGPADGSVIACHIREGDLIFIRYSIRGLRVLPANII